MMEPTLELLNYVANRPEVRDAVAPGYRALDLKVFAEGPKNVALGDEKGFLLFAYCLDGSYVIHYLLTSARRGPEALRFIKQGLRIMFTQFDVLAIRGSTPRENRAARAMNRALGARPIGVSVDSHGRACIDYVLERATWAISSADS